MADSSPPGIRPVQFIFLSGAAQPLTIQPGDRRFWLVDDAKTLTLDVPADIASEDDIQREFNYWAANRQLAPAADATLARAEQRADEHPSRTAPKCVDCAHYERGDKTFGNGPYCTHPAMPVDLVTGHMTTRAAQARSERDSPPCGVTGRLFELRNPPVLLSDEEAAVTLTAAELAQARWSPGVGLGPSSQSPASPAPAPADD